MLLKQKLSFKEANILTSFKSGNQSSNRKKSRVPSGSRSPLKSRRNGSIVKTLKGVSRNTHESSVSKKSEDSKSALNRSLLLAGAFADIANDQQLILDMKNAKRERSNQKLKEERRINVHPIITNFKVKLCKAEFDLGSRQFDQPIVSF
jgi:hypothetical protein